MFVVVVVIIIFFVVGVVQAAAKIEGKESLATDKFGEATDIPCFPQRP